MMLRSFNPVGQGAFYTEQFKNFTLVYDCGSDNNIELIEKEIKSVFLGDTKCERVVDKVFISHFDSDHVNGLEFLLNYCDVREIYIPFITLTEKVHLLIHQVATRQSNPFIDGLIIDPETTIASISSNCKVTFVLPVDHHDNDRLQSEAARRSDIKSGEIVASPKIPGWVFVPFNYQRGARSFLLEKELKARKLDLRDVDAFQKSWKDRNARKEILASYRAIPGGFNMNSMTLYSGPDTPRHRLRMVVVPWLSSNTSRLGVSPFSVGSLYLGDYEAKGPQKWIELYTSYEKYWGNIGTIQIPHHGSRHNYNDQLNAKSPVFSIISSGVNNRHRHPHCSTIRNIIENGGVPIVVSEMVGTRLQYYILPVAGTVSPRRATSEPCSISERGILIRISKMYAPQLPPEALYEATRGVWVVGPRRQTVDYAFAIAKGIVQEVYAIHSWHAAGTTIYNTRPVHAVSVRGRWEFSGEIAQPEIREKYLGKSVAHYFRQGAANPIRYT